MNASTSEYISGCESGWTMYLDQNSNSTDPYGGGFYEERGTYANVIEEDDEDLSMVSDASSGPPHYENSQYCGYASSISEDKTKTKKKSKSAKEAKQKKNPCLDDTASSSIFHFSQDTVPFSDYHESAGNLYSAAQFEDTSGTKKRLSFFKSSSKGKSASLLGRKKRQ